MPLTLAELKSMTQDALDQKVIDETRKSNFILQNIPFVLARYGDGGAWTYSYRRVTTKPSASTRALNSDYTASQAKVSKYSVDCKILGGNFEVDRASLGMQAGIDNLQFQVQQKTEAVSALFNDLFINGDEGSDATQFDGIDAVVTGTSTEANTSSAINLSTLANISTNAEAFRYAFRQWLKSFDGKLDLLCVNRDLSTVLHTVNDMFAKNTETRDSMSQTVPTFMGIPFVDLGEKAGSSNMVIATDGTSGETSMYGIRFGEDGVCGVAPEAKQKLLKVYLPRFDDGDDSVAVKSGAVEMVTSLAVKATRSAGAFRKIKIA